MTGTHGHARHEMTGQRGLQSRPASAAERAQRIFHELHGDGRHALCGICDDWRC
jgi:hypothetical protein